MEEYITEDYNSVLSVLSNLVVGETIADVGFGNFYPSFSPDGKKILYVSNKSADYFGLSSIYEYDIAAKESKPLIPAIRSTYDWVKARIN